MKLFPEIGFSCIIRILEIIKISKFVIVKQIKFYKKKIVNYA